MKQRILAIFLSGCILLGVLACGKKDNNDAVSESTASDAVSSASPMDEVLASGGETVDSINAKELKISQGDSGSTHVDLSFVLGSAREGVDEASTDKVPAYKAYYLEHPARLVLELEGLSYWSYESSLQIPEDSLFYGVFKQSKSLTNDFAIIFQLSEDCDISIADNKNVISIDFSPRAEQDEEKYYYVMADAQSAFNASKIVSGDLFLTLSNDLGNIVLISRPYKTEKESLADMKSLLAQNDALNEQNTFAISLEGNDLPSYGDSSKFAAVYSQPVIRRNDTPEVLPVIMPDGLYLCSKEDGTLSLFTKQEPSLDPDELDSQVLWVMDQNGKLRQLLDSEFTMVDKAAFSPDGRKLAFLENSSNASLLYVYDMDTNELNQLFEERVGSVTSSFIWDSLGTAIYMISGSDNSQQLLKYDFNISDESVRLTSVEENEIGEGDLGFLNGELYFANITDDNQEVIYKIKPEGGLRSEFAEGGSFRISPDGNHMAVLRTVHEEIPDNPNIENATANPEGEEGGEETDDGDDFSDRDTTILILHDMTTNEEIDIFSDGSVISYEWATDGKLYYAISISDDFSSDYSFMLCCYDPITGQSKDVAELGPSDFSTTPDPNVIYINLIKQEDDVAIQATYKFTID